MPRSLEAHRREHTKLIRFRADELALVVERARTAGRPVACFVRESSIGSAPRARRSELSDVLIRHLARVGSHLDDLSKVARKHALPRAAEFDHAVQEVLDLIRQID
jgi:hypothetical protein